MSDRHPTGMPRDGLPVEERRAVRIVVLDADGRVLLFHANDVDTSGQLDYELEDYTGSRWWPVAEVCASTERFYPGRLPELLTAHLAGTPIDEPFEVWS